MTLTITPFDAPIGAEVTGVDLRNAFDKSIVDEIYQAWLDHLVLIFRGQSLSKDEQVAFANQFGDVGIRATPKDVQNEVANGYDGSIMLVTNQRDEKGNYIGSLQDGEMWFHHDMSYRPEPHKATLLHALKLPSTGGNTKFANQYLAYENIPDDIKERIRGRKVLQAYNFTMLEKVNLEEGLDDIQHQWQPIFIKHPETGKTALYVSRLISAMIENLPREESDDILGQLIEIAEDRAIVYEHVWQPGDLAMWDNRCSTHARTDFPAEEARLLRRCTLEGAPMVGAA
ncbi:MAG: TauD/TfdA dioxygenase family protein [Alphaproteobacteria bacterium]|jgi:taurine dioxygenase